MLRTPKDFNYDKLADSLSRLDYKIAANDAVQYRVFTNDGFKLIDLASTGTGIFRNDLDVIVESDGNVKMPLLGRIKVLGLSIKEAEKLMEEKYAEFYVKPYVTLKVINKRVIVFPGNSGQAKVVTLLNNNTTIMEAIATAGGIPEDGKAYKIKLIRNNEDNNIKPFVYLMDLSRIEGVNLAYTKVQANDIIYVEPRYRPFRTLATELAPIATLLTTFLILVQFYRIK
ncbi:MAG: polysaccharide biosynthesis/export family protein [Bacteroidota bacterium]|nr:polysaccharide biosynthesis/export family protein [Bacteroidota bacterium]MDP3146407.1 polysaccharide biosynthesis/export family protein [Bacteroidota bacterium]MDP3557393.1 polysaccharide biosynthesis/export family protein [Bacteroidota bacterium]